jgi:hypothetical protein
MARDKDGVTTTVGCWVHANFAVFIQEVRKYYDKVERLYCRALEPYPNNAIATCDLKWSGVTSARTTTKLNGFIARSLCLFQRCGGYWSDGKTLEHLVHRTLVLNNLVILVDLLTNCFSRGSG